MPSKEEVRAAMEHARTVDDLTHVRQPGEYEVTARTLAAYCRELIEALRQAGEDIHNIGCAGDMYDEPHSQAHLDIMKALSKAPKEE